MNTKNYKKIEKLNVNYEKFKLVYITVSNIFDSDSKTESQINENIDNSLINLFIDNLGIKFSGDNILKLVNEKKISIEKQLSLFVNDTEPDETLIVYYAGEGITGQNGLSVYLTAKDSLEDDIIDTGISIQKIRDIFSSAYARRKILIINSSNSYAIHNTTSNFASFYSNSKNFEGEFIISYFSQKLGHLNNSELSDALYDSLSSQKPYLTLNEVIDNINMYLEDKNLHLIQKTVINSIGDLPLIINKQFVDKDDLKIHRIISRFNKSKSIFPDFKKTFSNFKINLLLIVIVIITYLSIFFSDKSQINSNLASNTNVKIENIRKSISLNDVQGTQVYNKDNTKEIEELFKKVQIFIKADSGLNAAIYYLKKVLEKDRNNLKAKSLLDSLSNTSM